MAALLYNGHKTSAECLTGFFEGETWVSSGCNISEPAQAAVQCLAGKNILFIGDSTNRVIFLALCQHLELQVHHHPCNMRMGWGCHDCSRGCHHESLNQSHSIRTGWRDAYANTASGTQITFSWKPEMLTIDDVLFLRKFAGPSSDLVDAVIAYKGIHEVWNFHDRLSQWQYTDKDLELEMGARAEAFAEMVRQRFPSSALFWRDSFYNGRDPEHEKVNSMLDAVLKPEFQQQGYHILPGHHVSRTFVDQSEDGIHPPDAVLNVMISMIASVLCP